MCSSMPFQLHSSFQPAGDQPEAIDGLVLGIEKNFQKQTLLGVTGSGKTFTIANVIEKVQMPTLVIAHNKTLAAQLCNEFREFFPDNAVHYFVSYYDYYQPEAYMPSSDTYIEKEAQINEEIDRLRHACTQSLLTRTDVIVVASVSAIYGLGSPTEYEKIVLHFRVGQEMDRRGMMEQLIAMQFERTTADLKRGSFRMRGQVFEVMPVNEEVIWRVEIGSEGLGTSNQGPVASKSLRGNAICRIEKIDPVTRKVLFSSEDMWLFPAKHYVVGEESRERAFQSIRAELDDQLALFQKKGKLLEYERLKRRVAYDLEMIKNVGYCSGIENYSRHFEGRESGEPPFTLLDYFVHGVQSNIRITNDTNVRMVESPDSDIRNIRNSNVISKNFLTVIDESHVTVPQIRGMYFGDRSRKDTLVEHGFRLPSARDNRPLMFDEFEARAGQTIYVSATPSEYEIKESEQIVEQIVRPTGLVDPEVIILPVTGNMRITNDTNVRIGGLQDSDIRNIRNSNVQNSNVSQVEDVIQRIRDRVAKGERALVTTLTKRMAEDLSEYLEKEGLKVKYLHSDILTIERIEIITELRRGTIDVIVGVNLLREGLDIPEVSLVAILDADKEGFLRSEVSLIQTIGRAARNVNGQVIMYADQMTGSIERAIAETDRRRTIQLAYNKKHGITPKTIEKNIRNILEEFGISPQKHKSTKAQKNTKQFVGAKILELDLKGDGRPVGEIIKEKEKEMKRAAKELQFELAALLRDEIRELKQSRQSRQSKQ